MVELRMVGAAALTILALSGAQALAQDPAPAAPEYQTLLTTLFTGNETIIGQPMAYPPGDMNLTSAIVTIPPGGETGWHIHEVPLFVYILSGEVSVDYGSEGIKTYVAGDSFLEAFEWPHNATNNGTEPVEIFAVYLGAPGLENAIAVDGPEGSAGLAPADHHVVAVHHLRPSRVSQNRLDFMTVAATDPVGLVGVEGNQTTPDLVTLGADDADSVTALEPSLDRRHARRQEALAAAEGSHRTSVHDHGAADLEVPGDPLLPRRARLGVGEEPGAAPAGGNGRERVHSVATGDDHGSTAGGRYAGRLDLRLHSPA